jgi:LysM repeat protein
MEQVFDSDGAVFISFEPHLHRGDIRAFGQQARVVSSGAVASASPSVLSFERERSVSSAKRKNSIRVKRTRIRFIIAGLVLSVIAVLGTISLTNAPARADVSSDAQNVVAYMVKPGDTLWSYASSMSWNGNDTGENVDELMELNHLSTPSLEVGQRIVVPVQSD